MTISHMGVRTSYEDEETLLSFLATQMSHGSLALVLGAGASAGFRLPQWDALLRRMYEAASVPMPDTGLELAAESFLRDVTGGDKMAFAERVKGALYAEADLRFDALRQNDLLAAIGALAMASSRGSVAQIVSFNFDDIVAKYLSYFGHDVRSLAKMPAWRMRADVEILHPHGVLPSDPRSGIDGPIVFTAADYDDVVGNAANDWHNAVLNVFRSHTCVFVGLSGADTNLRSLLKKANEAHARSSTGEMYWGVRLDRAGELSGIWEDRGVYVRTVAEFNEIPSFLFQICQRAAALRSR